MNSLTNFNFHNRASGQFFLSRQEEAKTIANHIQNKTNVVLYSGYKTGKQSLITQAFDILDKSKYEYILITLDLFNISSLESFISSYSKKLLDISKRLDQNALFPLSMDESKLLKLPALMDFPDRMGSIYGREFIIYFKNFHNVLNFNRSEAFLEAFEKAMGKRTNSTYVVSGSCVNMMRYIFEQKKYCFNMFEPMQLAPLRIEDVSEFLENTFMRTGRVIDKEISETIYDICGGHPWYIMQMASFCYNITLGYVNGGVIAEAKKMLLSLHLPRFMQMIGDLTENQVNFLRAVNNGVERYTSAEVMSKYHLNSSANVARIKEAMKKKEILMFDDKERGEVIDPLFKYWLKNYYFV